MKITLRKANALQNSVQDHIKSIEVKTSISLNEFQNVQAELASARDSLVANDTRRKALTKALYDIRAQVGRANATLGISDRLSEAAYIDKRLGYIKGLLENETATEAVDVLEGKLAKIRNRKEVAHSYYDRDVVATGVLTAEMIETFKSEQRELKKTKQKLNDEVLEINVRNDIELNTETVELLTKEGLV